MLTISFTGGVTPISWTLAVNHTGEIDSGTGGSSYLFTPLHAGVYTFYLNSTDAVGSTSDTTVVVTVEPALVATLGASLTTTQVGASSMLTISFTGGVTPISWTLAVNHTGEIDSGTGGSSYMFTPLHAGVYTFYLNSTDAVGSISDTTVVVTVEPALVATLGASLTTTQVGASSMLTISFTGGVTPISWTLQVN